MITRRRIFELAFLVALLGAGIAAGQERATAVGPDPKEMKAVVAKAAAYLKTTQGPDGSFSPQRAGPGISAVAAAALLRNGFSRDDPLVSRTLAYLEKKVQKDGGIYDRLLANYTTSVALMAFAEANKDGRYDAVIKRAT